MSSCILKKFLDRIENQNSIISSDEVMEVWMQYLEDSGISPYPEQEEAFLEIFSGNHVILNTPTGSGKSLVAMAALFLACAKKGRAFYTAPIKALVNEKFFALCEIFGAERVGMMTGDASIHTSASIICCTAEILSNKSLVEWEESDVDWVVMDEFHYYSDPERGVAWQVPLLTLPHARFLLMSATLGDVQFFQDQIFKNTGHEVSLVRSQTRPVPLSFQYSEEPILERIASLHETQQSPIYVVHFSQREASERAQQLMSMNFLPKEKKQEIRTLIEAFSFSSPFGKEMKKLLVHGVGIHHAGLLPKYRRLVESLAQKGLLQIICGTDTLGVGVNVPIRTVLFTKLCKYDGQKTKVLSVRDFQQIAGRAGRAGFDVQGLVVAQAPEHEIENKQLRKKAGDDPKKLRKLNLKKPPTRGYAPFNAQTFDELIHGTAESLVSQFRISYGMLLQVLSGSDEGCTRMKRLVRSSHGNKKEQRTHARRAIQLFRSLLQTSIVTWDAQNPQPQIHVALQEDFSLHYGLSLYLVEVLEVLDPASASFELDVLSLVEAVVENPDVVLFKQLDQIKSEAMAAMKTEGVPFEERIEKLEKIENPKPLQDLIFETLNVFVKKYPWLAEEKIRPKSIVRHMYELGLHDFKTGFNEYIKELGLARFEGVLLRYLSEVYKTLVQTVPEHQKTEALDSLIQWLGDLIHEVDSSLVEEWETLTGRDQDKPRLEPVRSAHSTQIKDITQDESFFEKQLHRKIWDFLSLVREKNFQKAAEQLDGGSKDLEACKDEGEGSLDVAKKLQKIEQLFDKFILEHGLLRTDPEARNPSYLRIQKQEESWQVWQTLVDSRDENDWFALFEVSLAGSRESGIPHLRLQTVSNSGNGLG